MLEIKNLSLEFQKGKKIFENINLEIKKNSITLISGNSGCGKSSLLMCISRVIPENVEGYMSGEIILENKNIEQLNPQGISGKIAYMFQDPDSQLCTFTVEDEIAFGLENINVKQEEMEDRIDEILDLVGITHLKKRPLNRLSGGEKQKVALASILSIDPEIILMDEPTANLDPKATEEMVKLIKFLRDHLSKTIVLVEHKLKEFINIVDEIVEFKKNGAKVVDKKEYYEEYNKLRALSYNKQCKTLEEPMLKVKGINFSYNKDRKILKDVSFTVNKGEIVGIVGYNGAGKSTLSKVLMGLLKPNSGEVCINDINISKLSPKAIGEHMGLVFQNPEHQFIKLTCYDELGLSLKIKGEKEDKINKKIEEYLLKFSLMDKGNLNPFTLSQGEKRRLSTASMMINGQDLLILDEPTYGQDRENLKELVDLLYEINKDGTTILIITHDMDMVLSLCNRVIYLDNGQVSYEGEPEKGLKEFLESGE